MTVGISLFLFAIGAIFYWAVTAKVAGIEIDTVGLILMAVGGIGLLYSLLWDFGAGARRARRADGGVDGGVERTSERTVERTSE